MKYLNALNLISGVGTQKFSLLLSYFPDPESIWKAGAADLRSARISEKLSERIVSERRNISPDQEWEKLEKEEVELISLSDEKYPALLKEITNPPYLIYKKGDFDLNQLPMVAIVGSRKYTSYGAQVASSFSRELANAGVTVISGMAIGIDTFSHLGALEKNGKTVAVLGNGLDDKNIYPRVNFSLSKRISSQGALISEYPIGTSAGPLTFPSRNRIVAGLSLGTIVIEAGLESGALITAQMALDYGREVFAIPGSIFSPQSAGANNLIKRGAKLVGSISDIFEEFDFDQILAKKEIRIKNPSTKEEEMILKLLSHEPIHIDTIAKMTRLDTSTISSSLAMMEIKEWTKNIGGQNYILL